MAPLTIHTVNARDNMILEVARDYFKLTPDHLFFELRTMLSEVVGILAAKGLRYAELKSGLVPSTKRREIAFVFDSQQISDGWYGRQVYQHVLPLFGRKSTHCVLAGDFLGRSMDQHELRDELAAHLVPANPYEYRNSIQFFVVYVNNLSDRMVEDWHKRLFSYSPYVGYVDMTFGSLLKLLFSTMLPSAFLLHHGVAIVGHEDDRSNEDNVDPAMHPFAESEIGVRSLKSYLFDIFLSYKIERAVLPEFESDSELSLNALTTQTTQFVSADVRLDASKLRYLLENKSGSLRRTGLLELSSRQIEDRIRRKLNSNYIYSLTHDPEHDVIRFNIIIEVSNPTRSARHRVLLALEYMPMEGAVRIITLY